MIFFKLMKLWLFMCDEMFVSFKCNQIKKILKKIKFLNKCYFLKPITPIDRYDQTIL